MLFPKLATKLVGQLFIHISTVANGHQADDSSFLLNGIDDAKSANAIHLRYLWGEYIPRP